ncbi:mobilization protein, partial [Campylobacter jejuni]|nr:mobilization protein [Campylobacter jejuni]
IKQKMEEVKGSRHWKVVIKREEVSENDKGEKQTKNKEKEVCIKLDNNGLQLARREASLNKDNLSKIQTLTAKSLKMERGANRYENNEKQTQYIQDYKTYAQSKEQKKALIQRI